MANNEGLLEQELVLLREALAELIASSSVLEEFGPVWNRIGLNTSQRQVRRETIAVHISNLLKDILQEEQELEKTMISSLQDNEVELAALCKTLSIPMEEFPTDQSLYERERITRTRVDALNKIKFDRQKRMKRIREMENSLCKELGEKSNLPSKSYLPSEEELKSYLQAVENMEHTLNERRTRHSEVKEHVNELSGHLSLELGEEFVILSSRKKFVYNVDNMIQLEETFQKFELHIKELEKEASELRQVVESLWERLDIPDQQRKTVLEKLESFRQEDIDTLREELQRLDELKREHMETFISKTRAELRQIWNECLYGVQQQREFSPAFVDGPFDDDLLSAHESELDRMRGFYHDNLEIFKLIKKREESFKQYCELERKDNDPMRFSNRGGQLLKDQAMKKQLKKDLPRLEKELNSVLEQWEEDHERYFMVNDGRYLDTIKMQWSEKEANKCQEKIKKQKEKEALKMMEMTYGSQPTTPKKRIIKRPAASPLAATAPSKLRKVEQSPLVRPTTTAGSRLPRGSRKRNAKTPMRPTQRRQDRRKILTDKNAAASSIAVDDSFLSSHNFSLASAGSYTDFQHGIMMTSEVQKHCRSSAIPKNSSMENTNY